MNNAVELAKIAGIGDPAMVIISQINICILIACQAVAVGRIVTKIRKLSRDFVVITNAFARGNPDAMLLIAHKAEDTIEDQRIFYAWSLMKAAQAVSIKAVKAITCSNPDKTITVLCNAVDLVIGQSFFFCK